MRMSDWCSDVCSSDLVYVLRCLAVDSARRRAGFADTGRVRPVELPAHHGRQLRDVDRHDHLGPARGAASVASGRGVERLRSVTAACNDDRSEEHTSELQSLMRISYAVFCLKKKIH